VVDQPQAFGQRASVADARRPPQQKQFRRATDGTRNQNWGEVLTV
jgi:hypothetical protein